mmetsp:Transcript_21932/g.46613  ORF Transcript_21932/g.46613 Transcript_21932/m.46613 type:complete len:197 (+) Transcript_21932:103-693(+)
MVLCPSTKAGTSHGCLSTACLSGLSVTVVIGLLYWVHPQLATFDPVTWPRGDDRESSSSLLTVEFQELQLEVRNLTAELRSELGALRRQLQRSAKREREAMLRAMARQRGELLEAADVEREALAQLRANLLNLTAVQHEQLKEVLVEQLRTLEGIKERGTGKKDKLGLWGLLSSTVQKGDGPPHSQDANFSSRRGI